MGTEPVDYCREIENYLCRKNDGHLIRVVGPSFEVVSRWAVDGVPLPIAFRGIDRYFERYYRKGVRRRPVRIDFCDADVRDVFDEWRRALGLASPKQEDASEAPASAERRGPSLPAHLERAVLRLTSARVSGALGADADGVIDRIAAALDEARASSRGVRGEARQRLIDRLTEFDRELVAIARAALGQDAQHALELEARAELDGFRGAMAPDAYERACAAAGDRLVRERVGLPTLAFD